MMKLTTKFLMAGAVAAVAIAVSAAPSDAARKKRMAAAPNCNTTGLYCSQNCANGWCSVYVCGMDGRYTPAVLTPVCMQGMCANIRKRC
jgi:hypothetical protein